MSHLMAFEDDVEPVDDVRSRQGTPSRGRGAASNAASGSRSTPQRVLSPEPDEELDTNEGKHNMWLVKVPRFLLEGWTKVDEEDKRLGTVRVYAPDHRGNQKMELLLPEAPEPPIPLPPSHPYLQTNYPRRYDLRLIAEQGSVRVKNLYAFKERMEGGEEEDFDEDDEDDDDRESKARKTNKGRRVVAMAGTITNEAALKPQVMQNPLERAIHAKSSAVGLTPEYREVLRKRRLEASQPKHRVKELDASDRAATNMLTSGVFAHNQKQKASNLVSGNANINANKRGQGSNEKFARMPRNELLDILFELFDDYPYWGIKGLREKVQQPEAYLREVLASIADLHRRGPYTGNWSLKEEFREMRKEQQRQQTERQGQIGANKLAADMLNAGGNSSTTTEASLPNLSSSALAQSSSQQQKLQRPTEDNEEDQDEDDLEMEDVE